MMLPRELRQLSFGALVQYLRKSRGLTQIELAAKAACSSGYLSEIECGEVPKRLVAEHVVAALDPYEDDLPVIWDAYARAVAEKAAREAQEASAKNDDHSSRHDSPSTAVADTMLDSWDGRPLGPLVGREWEVARLRRIIRQTCTAPGIMVALSGEPGIGKTRLAIDAMLCARAENMLTAVGYCYDEQRTVAFVPFIDLLEQVMAATTDEIRQDFSTRWPLLNVLLSGGTRAGSGDDGSSTIRGHDESERLFRQVTDFLCAVSVCQPVALLIDDLHWADEASLDLLSYLMLHVKAAHIVILVTLRDTEVARQAAMREILHPLQKKELLERIALSPLSDAQTTEMLNAYLPSGSIAPEVSGLVYTSASGVPYPTLEHLRGLLERGELIEQAGVWQRTGTGTLKLPPSILDEVREHVLRLQSITQQVLRNASVLGEVFSVQVVSQMCRLSRDEVEDALAEAVAAGLAYETEGEGYRFRHALTRDAIVTENRALRRRLHRVAAEALLRLPPRRGRAAELALHFRQGDEIPQALKYSLEAGDEAEAAYAHKDALQHYEIAVGLARDLGDEGQEAEALERLADVQYRIGFFKEAHDNLVRATVIYRSLRNWERLTWATCQMARTCDALGKVPESMRFVEALLDTLIAVADTSEPGATRMNLKTLEARAERAASILSPYVSARLLLCIEVRMLFLGRFAEVYPFSVAAVAHAQRADDLRLESLAYTFRASAQLGLGRFAEMLVSLHDAQRTAEACGDLEAIIEALGNLADYHWEQADLYARDQVLRQILEKEKKLGAAMGFHLYLLSQNEFMLGHWEAARSYGEEAIPLSAEREGMEMSIEQVTLRYFDAVKGKVSLAEMLAAPEVIEALHTPDPRFNLGAASFLSEPEILAGYASSARERLRKAIDCCAFTDSTKAEALARLAWAECTPGDTEQARSTLIEARLLADSLSSRMAYSVIWRVEAIIALSERRWDDCRHAVENCLELVRAMPYPYAEAKALYIWGQLSRECGNAGEASGCFAQALAILNGLGERLYAERIEREMAEIAQP